MPILTLHPTGQVVHLDPGETVLGGLHKAGYAYTVGCRRGGCGICKVDARAGEFTYDHPVADSVISPDEAVDGTCLSCRAVPTSDLTIELRGESVRLVNPFLRQLNDKALQRATADTTAYPGVRTAPRTSTTTKE